ncbi:MAG: hypothetical protein IPQ04_14350 [Saprospiraceae bacterium]|nr:hypothetical protein [Saprospiraceae bacterium]
MKLSLFLGSLIEVSLRVNIGKSVIYNPIVALTFNFNLDSISFEDMDPLNIISVFNGKSEPIRHWLNLCRKKKIPKK